MLEKEFQHHVKKRLKETFNGCIVMKNDAGYIQGIPDLIVLYGSKWAALEIKRSSDAHVQPNQEWYVEKMNEMSYATILCPQNEEVVFDELEQLFLS